jgi:hypothetical protein
MRLRIGLSVKTGETHVLQQLLARLHGLVVDTAGWSDAIDLVHQRSPVLPQPKVLDERLFDTSRVDPRKVAEPGNRFDTNRLLAQMSGCTRQQIVCDTDIRGNTTLDCRVYCRLTDTTYDCACRRSGRNPDRVYGRGFERLVFVQQPLELVGAAFASSFVTFLQSERVTV